MKPIHDDPKLTAYLLGELPPAQRAEVEARLLISEEGQALLEELRATAAALDESLVAELDSLPGLGPWRMAQVMQDPAPARRPLGWWVTAVTAAAAACMALGVLGMLILSHTLSPQTPAPIAGTQTAETPAHHLVPPTRQAPPPPADGQDVAAVALFAPSVEPHDPEPRQLGSVLHLLGIDVQRRLIPGDLPGESADSGLSAGGLLLPVSSFGPSPGEDPPPLKSPFSFDPS